MIGFGSDVALVQYLQKGHADPFIKRISEGGGTQGGDVNRREEESISCVEV